MPRLVSRAEFARLCGVSKAAITKACGKLLAGACEADRLDVDHPAAAAYLGSKRSPAKRTDAAPTTGAKRRRIAARPTTANRKPSRKRPSAPTARRPKREPGPPAATPDELDAYADLLGPIIEKFGTARGFADWLKASKDIEAIRARQLENEEAEGRLISRDFVKTHVLGLVEACWRRLLQDATKTIARRIYAAAKSAQPVEEAERIVAEILSANLEPLKTTAAKLVRDA